jgi:hypothetical protein
MQPWNGSLPPPPPVPGRQVNVSEATSVTVYEMTGWMGQETFDIYTLMHGGGMFWTVAMLEEKYTVTSDGNYLTIHCYRNPPYPCSGTGVGNNIAAVKLNGVLGYEEGIWASFIVDYTIGTEGTAESRFNALGNDTQLGPYLNSPCTYLGDYDSELVLGFSTGGVVPVPPVEASIDFDMNSFNPTSKGTWVTAYIGLPEGYSVSDIDISTVMLNDIVPATGPSEVKDFDHDGYLELMVKFDRKAALETMVAATDVEVTVSGSLNDGTDFLGTDNITIRTGKLISAAIVGSFIGALAGEPSLSLIIILVFVSLLAIAVARPFLPRRRTN